MASIIKNQILKHLSKFTKNMSPDKINLSTLKGEGELSNLELDEAVLMELLDLPTWMKLSKAVCNRLSIKVQWTKLKSQPLCLFLDEVELEIETCDTPRPPKSPAHVASYRSGGKYGFVDRVIDGMYVHINSVLVKFISRKFHASLQLSRVKAHSVTPSWKYTEDLGPTKIRDTGRGEILLFKEFDWQTTRIEATAVEGAFLTTPLRFIANQSKIRITIKKRLSDCGVIATRVMLLLDDLLWVLTDTQLKAAILYINSLKDMMEKSRQQSKNIAAEKLDLQGLSSLYNDNMQSQRPRSQSNVSNISHLFDKYDVQTTSYHVVSSIIDLHLCDDNTTDTKSIPGHNSQIEGGAMQVTIHKLSVDVYPFFPAGGERKNWFRYTDNQGSRNPWVQQLFAAFKKEVTKAKECIPSPSPSPAHTGAQKTTQNAPVNQSKAPPSRPPPPRANQGQGSPNVKKRRQTKLLESCYVIKVEEFTVYQVSTADNKRNSPQKFLSSDKKHLHLPPDMSVIHAEFTDYFFPEGIDYPVPHANLYVLLNPIRLNLDWLTLLWANFFMLNLSKSIESIELEDAPLEHVDMKVEAIMPRIVIPVEDQKCVLPDFPKSVQLQISRVCATNTRVSGASSRESLSEVITNYTASPMFSSKSFPNDNNSLRAVPDKFNSHAKKLENNFIEKKAYDMVNGFAYKYSSEEIGKLWKTDVLKRDASFDVWCCHAEQVWLEFLGPSNGKGRPFPFVESIPVCLWISKAQPKDGGDDSESSKPAVVPYNNGHSLSNDEKSSSSEHSSPERRRTRRLLKDYYSSDSETKSVESEDSIFQGSQSTCDSNDSKNSASDDNVQYTATRVADFNLLAKIGPGPLRAQMTHSQYIFVMRLLESFTFFQTQMKADVDYFITTVSPAVTFSVPLVLSELEFAMLCPAAAEAAGIPVTFISPPTSTSGPDDLVDEVIEKEEESSTSDTQTPSEIQDNSGSPNKIFPHVDLSELSHPALGKSYSDSNVQTLIPTSDHKTRAQGISESSLQSRNSQSSQALGSIGQESGYSSDAQQGKKLVSKTTDSMKKFSFKMSGLKDKIKAKMENFSDDTLSISDSLDSMSIRTDSSDDDMDFEELSLDDLEMPAFKKTRPESESMSTDTADDLSSFCAEQNAAEARGKERVCVVLFKLTALELLLQGDGDDTAARIQARQLLTIQPGNLTLETFQQKFLSPSGFFGQEKGYTTETPHSVMLKFTSGPSSRQDSCPRAEEGFLSVKAHNFGLHFKTSSLTTLTNFIEDDNAGESTPMHVDVSNFMLILQDDMAPPGFPSPPEPTHIQIHSLTISRGKDGVMHLNQNQGKQKKCSIDDGTSMATKVLNVEVQELKNDVQVLKQGNYEEHLCLKSVKLRLQELEAENRVLREQSRKCSSDADSVTTLNQTLETYTTENARLIERIANLEDELLAVTREKDSFIGTLTLLQEELSLSERRRHDSDK